MIDIYFFAVVESIMKGEVGITPRRSRSSMGLAHSLNLVSNKICEILSSSNFLKLPYLPQIDITTDKRV